MPFALLLQDLGNALKKGSGLLNPWVRLVEMEELLIDRARGAFLVHWFGAKLPMQGLSLKVHIANLGDLAARYREIQQQQRPDRWGMNLVTPVANLGGSLTGSLVGMALNPVSLISGIVIAARSIPRFGERVLSALGSIGRLLLNLLLVPIGLPLGLAAGVQHGGAGRLEDSHQRGVPERGLDQLLNYFQLTQAATDLVAAVRPFLQQIIAEDRNQVQNPLLRALLRIGDLLSGLMSQVIGFAAILIDRVAPLIDPLVEQGIAAYHLVSAVMELVDYLIQDLAASLGDVGTRAGEIFTELKERYFGLLRDAFSETGVVLGYMARALLEAVRPGLQVGRELILNQFRSLRGQIEDAPVVRTLALFPSFIKEVTTALKEIAAAYSAKPSGLLGRAAGALFRTAVGAYRTYRRFFPSTSPPFPVWSGTPDTAAITRTLGGRPGFGIEALAELPTVAAGKYPITDPSLWQRAGLLGSDTNPDALERSLRESYSPAVRAELGGFSPVLGVLDGLEEFTRQERERLGNPSAALARARAAEQPYRDLFTAVLGRILPGEARVHMEGLLEVFRTVDRKLYGLPPGRAQSTEFPVLDLPDDGTLRPVLRRVTFSVPEGIDTEQVRAFKDLLLRRLREQDYPVGI